MLSRRPTYGEAARAIVPGGGGAAMLLALAAGEAGEAGEERLERRIRDNWPTARWRVRLATLR